MNLPSASIPNIPLPFSVPEMMHPAIVHFAVALPVVIILLELINLVVRRKILGGVNFFFMILMVIVYFGAYVTGTVDARHAKDMISPETKTLLEAHTSGGVWMVYGSLLVIFFKIVSLAVKKLPARIIFLVVLGLFFWATTGVVQNGCALTYKHGVNVATQNATQKTQSPAMPAATETREGHEAEAPTTTVTEAVETVKEKTEKVVETTQEKVKAATTAVKEKAAEAVETVKEKAGDVVEKAKDIVKEVTQPNTETPAKPITPVETVPAG